MYTTLIQPTELARLLSERNVAILDCRHDLVRPEWSDHVYREGHIPHAIQAHLDRDLSAPVGPQTGRHPLPDSAKLAEKLGHWGIDDDVQVVAYDQGNGMFAARAWWLLRWLGHTAVAVLDGGYAAWQEAGLPVSSDVRPRPARTFMPRAVDGAYVTTAELQEALEGKPISLVDARGADRFAGENETIDPIAGHIPGAVNHPFARNVDARGRFHDAAQLRDQWSRTLGGHAASEVVAMCGSGVSACHNLLALEIAGLPGARLYAGSWSEWIRDEQRPVAKGPA